MPVEKGNVSFSNIIYLHITYLYRNTVRIISPILKATLTTIKRTLISAEKEKLI